MKLLHLADLHLGKILHGYSLLDDQSYILSQITEIAETEKPDVVLIAGDVYDKSIAPAEAVRLFDTFLQGLHDRHIPVCIISGNHDSADRLAFGAGLMAQSGVYFSPVYNGTTEPIVFEDKHGKVCVYLLPFIKPVHVQNLDADAASYTDAVRFAVSRMQIDPADRNVLVTHQFVTGAERSDSEDISVGGSDNVDADVFAPFDYVALGHLHRQQHVGTETIRYSGTPLKYSISEKDHEKSVTVVELSEKGNVQIRTVPLTPLHDIRELRGSYDALTFRENYLGTATDDYLHIILTDEDDIPDTIGKLRMIYPNLMKLDYDNTRTRTAGLSLSDTPEPLRSPAELFAELYEKQNGQPMLPEQSKLVDDLFRALEEGDVQ